MNNDDYKIYVEYLSEAMFVPYSYLEFEQAFWHLWTLNTYHVTMSFDVNMVLLLDWAISYHLELGADNYVNDAQPKTKR